MTEAVHSDAVQIWTAAFAMIVAIFSGIMTYMMARLTINQNRAAVKVEEVKQTLEAKTTKNEAKLDDLAIMGKATHTLVNSSMSAQLKLVAELSRWKANQTNAPEDTQAADVAERLYREQQAKQARVDAQPGTDAQKSGGR